MSIADELKACVLLPSYNNCGTAGRVVDSLLNAGYKVIAVNDGSTDGTRDVFEQRKEKLAAFVSYPKNRGKGYALAQGLKKAGELGFRFAISIDADGQHTLKSIDSMLVAEAKLAENPEKSFMSAENTIIIGSRFMRGKDSGSKFANNFSNFWFTVQTGFKLPDTQSGCRIYPVKKLSGLHYFTTRYEFELEILVRGAWMGMNLLPVPAEVVYEQVNRVSHFRPGKDFTRISVLNVFLTILAPIYGYPKKLISRWRNYS
jgi:glycosyltransferase involved in cell wall biosynthesis